MSWTRTHEWWQALLEAVAEIERRQDGSLPWQPRYAEIFGDREGLRRALAYRWTLIQQAQLEEPYEPDGRPSRESRSLAARHRAVRLVLGAVPEPIAATPREYAIA